jgi:hypothetical protein
MPTVPVINRSLLSVISHLQIDRHIDQQDFQLHNHSKPNQGLKIFLGYDWVM